jgi:demethylmenaquinone methyltransferase/2-methoxy-6-polyprenyl-1,4-benzoquinol methylase
VLNRETLAPHRPLTHYYARAEDRQRHVTDLFDRTATHYEWICRVMSLGLGQTYRRQALERSGLTRGMRVLDVATGTGLVARAAAEVVGSSRCVVGLDPSRGMLLEARKALPVPLVQGVGETLPFPGDSFDFISNAYALRHVGDLEGAFAEYRRVLKPGGRLLILEISRPSSRVGLTLLRFYLESLVPWIARWGTGSGDARLLMKYYWDTIAECVPPGVILSALAWSGFRRTERRVVFGIFSEYVAVK